MSKGEGGGRPRKHPHPQAIGQFAIDAEWQEIADEKSEAIVERNHYGSMNALTAVIDDSDQINSKFAAVVLMQAEIAKDANREDINTLYNCLRRYLEFCLEHNVRITNAGAYSACGISRNMVKEWASGLSRADRPEYKQFAIYIRSICDKYREMLMAEGKIHPVIGIWWQKNYDGFTDKPPEAIEAADEAQDLSASEIAQKYAGIGDD